MKPVILSVASLLCMGLAAFAAYRTQSAALPPTANAPATVSAIPQDFGPIHPRISPDGRQALFSWQGAIWRLPVGGVMARISGGSAGFDIEPAWSHDAGLIAYVSSPRTAGGTLRVIRAATGEELKLPVPIDVADARSYSKLTFHPDGRLLGNFRTAGKDAGIALLDLQTGALLPLAKPLQQSRYSLSHDGRWLVHTGSLDVDGQQGGNDGPQADIWKVSTAGGEPEKLTRFPSRVHDVCWSADGKELFVVSEVGGAHNDIWRIALTDPERSARRITFGAADEERPSVSSDGRYLMYTSNARGPTRLERLDLTTQVESAVTVAGADFGQPTGQLTLSTIDRQSGTPVVARVTIQQADGKFYAPAGALYRMLLDQGHFYCDREARLVLPAGKYRVKAFRGPEYVAEHAEFAIAPGQNSELKLSLQRWTNAAERGWYSGENHIHANYGYGHWYNTPATMLQQCAGEDLRICNFMVANSDTDGVYDREFFRGRIDPVSTSETVLYWNQEFRSTLWGHMTLVNLSQLVEPIFTGFKDTTNPWDTPTNSDIADRTHVQQGLVNYTHGAQHPDDQYIGAYAAKGIPVDVALGRIDTMDLNASYIGSVPLWYRLLNCGFRVSASAGTDCFLNRIGSRLPGADRVYVKLEGDTSYRAWIDGLKAGRSFVSSGPMLEIQVENEGPGGTVKQAAPRELRVNARVTSQFPLDKVELVFNGKVAATATLAADKRSAVFDAGLMAPRSGWISLRASGPVHPDHSGGPLEAHTNPVYVEVAGQPTVSREDARYFLDWIERLSLAVRVRDRIPTSLKKPVLDQIEAARVIYARMAE